MGRWLVRLIAGIHDVDDIFRHRDYRNVDGHQSEMLSYPHRGFVSNIRDVRDALVMAVHFNEVLFLEFVGNC